MAPTTVTALLLVSIASLELGNAKVINQEIYNGHAAQRGQIPYIAFLQINTAEGTFACGSSIISKSWILTAAHCVQGASSCRVTVGIVDSTTLSGGTSYSVSQSGIYPNSGYNPTTTDNDIALVKLPKELTLSDYVSTIPLPKMSQADPNTFANQLVVSSGWGYEQDDDSGGDILHYTSQLIMDHDKCKAKYAQLSGRPNAITDNMICALRQYGNRRTGTCEGDSGGPIVRYTRDSKPLMLIGVTSWGIGECSTSNPEVITNVAKYLTWINKVTGIPVS